MTTESYRIHQYIESVGNYVVTWVAQAIVDDEVMAEERAGTLPGALTQLSNILLAEVYRLRNDVWLNEYRGTSGA